MQDLNNVNPLNCGLMISSGRDINRYYVEKFGKNTAVASGTEEVITDNGGVYPYLTTARKHNIASSSAEDGAGTLTGALTIDVQGLDTNWNLVTETVTMNGLANVETANTYIRIFRVRVLTAGSAGTNVGIISATAQVDATVSASILAGKGQTNMAIYSIPAGYNGYLMKWYCHILRGTGVTATAADIDIYERGFGQAWRSKQPVGIQNDGSGDHEYEFPFPLYFPAKTDIEVRATPTANASIGAGFTILLEKM